MTTPAPSSIPTGLRPKAQGCALRATLGHASPHFPQPQRGCGGPVRTVGHNPVGVVAIMPGSPRVVSRTRQPWATCLYPVGVLNQCTETQRLADATQCLADATQRLADATQRLAALYERKLAARHPVPPMGHRVSVGVPGEGLRHARRAAQESAAPG
jgi:hypothetical protein